MIRAVLFDLDNTLIDFMKMKRMCVEAAVAAMVDAGLPMSQQEAREKLFAMYWEVGIEDQRIFDRFIQRVMGKLDYKVLAAAVAAYRRVKAGHLTPYPHARSALLALRERGLRLGIVSDAPAKQAWLRLAESSLLEFFDFVVTLDESGKRKPDPGPFRRALRKLRLEPGEVLFVGDWPERDIKGARAVGMKTALAAYGGDVREGRRERVRADFVLQDLGEVLEVVDRLGGAPAKERGKRGRVQGAERWRLAGKKKRCHGEKTRAERL